MLAIPVPGRAAGNGDFTLEKKGISGSPVLIRIFKQESELELWMQKDGRFELFATYPICFWSGKLDPKLRESDRQAPEGLYAVDLSDRVFTQSGSIVTGPVRANARQMNPQLLPDLCNAANGEFVPAADKRCHFMPPSLL
jgi:hypothetical protein